jgi:hypothetical protein
MIGEVGQVLFAAAETTIKSVVREQQISLGAAVAREQYSTDSHRSFRAIDMSIPVVVASKVPDELLEG